MNIAIQVLNQSFFSLTYSLDPKSIVLAKRAHSREIANQQHPTLSEEYLQSDDISATEQLNTAKSGATIYFSIDTEDEGKNDIAEEKNERRVNFYSNNLTQEESDSSVNDEVRSHASVKIETSRGRSIHPHGDAKARATSPGNVYDRLSARGRVYAERRMRWAPPEVNVSFIFCYLAFLITS